MIAPNLVVFHDPKLGHQDWEWEDGAAGCCGADGRNPRFAVADGATEGFGSARWAHQLVSGFVGPDGPATRRPPMHPEGVHGWFEQAQRRWHTDADSAGASDLQRLKRARVGSLATVLGCEVRDPDGPRPRWEAVSVGDTVLFHVRGQRLVQHFPALAEADFGVNPDGVSTRPERLADTVDRLAWAGGDLEPGDLLYLATDALAQWLVRGDGPALWGTLAALVDPADFLDLVTAQRRARAMTNDDVTLLRVRMDRAWPTRLVVWP